ncbi:hypothetical protein FHS95_003593 [Sphingomonas naasensis]|uniref:Uncharacterized protein n=1 Tax=Sphingomonas naasensis TaxID=1344951 RepID=A0A4S1WH36_9SPHN|nr:hypothetical protein [Sphingomonas naasensis]NIJ21882.1 hypothetical protein [Sphingomonas naasensis]TGX42424.1 hypothetical protein E5A74_11315 [Sphingomonas naasensis]
MLRLALLLPLLPLAACDGSGTGTSIKINAKSDENGSSTTVSTDGNGQAAIKVPGFEGSIKLPQIHVNAENFDLNGVKLYPNSQVKALNVDANSGDGGKDEGTVDVTFESPAPLATVQGWFRDKMTARGFRVEADGTGLKGSTDEGDPFRLQLGAEGDQKTKGRLEVGSK